MNYELDLYLRIKKKRKIKIEIKKNNNIYNTCLVSHKTIAAKYPEQVKEAVH